MNEHQPEADKPAVDPVRKPYTAPCIEESGQFEHMVLNCSQNPGGPVMCMGDEQSMA